MQRSVVAAYGVDCNCGESRRPAGTVVVDAQTNVQLERPSSPDAAGERACGGKRRQAGRAATPVVWPHITQRRVHGTDGRARFAFVFVRQRRCRSSAGAAQHRFADLHAGARRIEWVVRAGNRNGRVGGRGGYRSNRVEATQLRRNRREQRPSLVEQVASGMLCARRGIIRLVAARPASALDARRPLGDRYGHGHGRLSGQLPSREREGADVRGWAR